LLFVLLSAVQFQVGDNQGFGFAHGQHLTFRRHFDGVEVRRSYSICAPAPGGELKVGIKLVDGGVFSTWANQELVVGDEIDVMTPTGNFTSELRPDEARTYVLVAAGSGITPIVSIAATVLAAEPDAIVTLLQVNQTTSSIMLLEEVEALRNRYLGRLQIWNVLTREPTAAALFTGRPDRERLDAFLAAGVLPTDPTEVFVCGPEELVATVRSCYAEHGVDPAHIHDELFTSSQLGRVESAGPREIESGTPPVATGEAVLHGRETKFALYEGDSILDSAQRSRPDVPFSCRAGVCSTCRAFLSEGEVEMEVTHGLVPGEAEAGYVLTCQARPTTPTVRVDYDR
jgi:ring-1,2-phenylacetyl-CoA epoxidase subunit PaaE